MRSFIAPRGPFSNLTTFFFFGGEIWIGVYLGKANFFNPSVVAVFGVMYRRTLTSCFDTFDLSLETRPLSFYYFSLLDW